MARALEDVGNGGEAPAPANQLTVSLHETVSVFRYFKPPSWKGLPPRFDSLERGRFFFGQLMLGLFCD